MFKSVTIKNWRQFENIQIDFHKRLTILTGANGAGKTTILNTVNRHFGWPSEIVGTPTRDEKTGGLKFFSDMWKTLFDNSNDIDKIPNNHIEVGSIEYVGDKVCKLTVPAVVGTTYNLNYTGQQAVKGLHIPSHRPVYKYQPISNISTQVITKQQAYNQYNQAKVNRYQSGGGKFENYHIKETLISLATFGFGNEVVIRNSEAVNIFRGFEEILKIILPPKLGFEKIAIRIPEVVLITRSGDFSLDAVSGGIASIIDLAWQLYMFEEPQKEYVVTLDEPENHLHPEMQKSLLPNFLKAFPNVQFIIATHNPFIISSVPDSNVFVLNYNANGKVDSILLENIEKSGSANDILREVLGIETTMPEWVDEELDKIITKYSDSGITPENILSFKSDIKKVGLDKYVSTSVATLIEKSKKK